ncbi:hypothetical protein ACIF6I_22335 [Streptomyces microflavus]|uniref:hypothetical protein n=1 Tax=Streptomyces microflavus TaxID=1919 RepID=UPI00343CC173
MNGGSTDMMRAFSSAATVAIATALTAIAAVTTAGCIAAAPPDRPAPERSHRSGGPADGNRELTAAEEVLVRRAEQLLVKECMEKAGFPYWADTLPAPDDLKGGGYFLTDVGWAKRHGYGSRLQRKAQNTRRDDRNSAYVRTLPDEKGIRYSDTLLGTPSKGALTAELPGGGTVETPRDGCRAAAKGRLYGDHPAWFHAEKTATNLTSLYVPDLVEDPRFTGAVTAWSACMRAAGHDHATPPAAREKLPELTRGLNEPEAYAVEVGLAVAEATCATTTPLAETARALDTEYREKRLARYSGEIAAYRQMRLDALDRAERITGSTA